MTPFEWLETLLECAVDELDNQEPPFKLAPPRQYVSAEGQVVFDDCCEHGGQVWTRILTAMPVDPLPNQDTTFSKCAATMGVQIGVGIIRCGHTLDEQGTPPTPEQLTADARQIAEDMTSLRRAILCCAEGRKILGPWTPAPGSWNFGGGCIGGEWEVWVPARFTQTTSSPGSP